MKTFITQPTYLPWIGIFKAIDYCDNFVFYNDVQFEKQSWQQRNRIISTNVGGKGFIYLNVPVIKKPLNTLINNIEISQKQFYERHLELIQNTYLKTPFCNEVIDLLKQVYRNNYKYLSELNINLIKVIGEYIGINTNYFNSDVLNIKGGKSERLINICKSLNSDMYLSPIGSKVYLNEELFKKNKLKIRYLEFNHPIYSQMKKPFFSHLSIIDVLVNIGPRKTKNIIHKIKLKES